MEKTETKTASKSLPDQLLCHILQNMGPGYYDCITDSNNEGIRRCYWDGKSWYTDEKLSYDISGHVKYPLNILYTNSGSFKAGMKITVILNESCKSSNGFYLYMFDGLGKVSKSNKIELIYSDVDFSVFDRFCKDDILSITSDVINIIKDEDVSTRT